jgi:hypothetical protein
VALSVSDLQALRDDAIQKKAAGVVNVRFSDGKQVQYVATQDQWQKIIADLNSMITAASGLPEIRFTLPTFRRE